MVNAADLTGQRFGRLTVVNRVQDHVSPSGKHRPKWECICECGGIVEVLGQNLKNGRSQSCGCLNKEHRIASITKHGHYGDRVYYIWEAMKRRCYNKNNSNYGNRGIKVCEEWQEFIPFYEWAIANGYNDNLTIDRINVNGNYEPDNCRWATMKEQGNNRRNNHLITYQNTTRTIAQWAEELGINYNTLWNRINKYHWSVERALTT